jgi:peroxin-1
MQVPQLKRFEQILSNLVSQRLSVAKEPLSFVIDESDPLEYTRLVETEGYSPVDLWDLVTRMIQVAVGHAVSEAGVGVEKVCKFDVHVSMFDERVCR